ncbi:MAG TPA: septum formation family protein, partial [Acidimicrobiia bacterium]
MIAMIAVGCGGGGQSVFEMEVGMCFDDVDVDEVTSVPTVDCSEPHDNEVFDIFDYTEAEYPGQDAMNDAAQQLCIDGFEAYVGITYQESELEVFAITPT